VRREYEDAGVRVITHGQRGYLWKDTDVAFLYRQLDEMRRHRRVVSNRMSSAVLYAAAAGIEAGVYGDPMALESDHAILGGVGKPRRMWPDMHQVSIPADLARAVADEELGADEILHPEEVIEAFGWTGSMGPRPGPPPPAPSLEFPVGLLRGRRRARDDSHRGPAGAEASMAGPSWFEEDELTVAGETAAETSDEDRTTTDEAGADSGRSGSEDTGGDGADRTSDDASVDVRRD
jgi:hypothetical protein